MKNTLLMFLFGLIQQVFGAEYVLNETALHTDARDFSMGGLICDYESSCSNEINLTCLIPFQMYDLSVRKIDFSRNNFGLRWKVEWSQSGNNDWMENIVGFHVGKKLSDQLYLGVNTYLLLVDNVDVGLVGTCFAELEGHYKLNEKLTLGISMVNPTGSRIKSSDKNLSFSGSAHLGVEYSPTIKCRIYTEMDGQIQQPLRFRMGLEYIFNELLLLRTGFSTSPLLPSWGIGGTVRRFRYSWGGNMHPILGFSNGFTLNYRW